MLAQILNRRPKQEPIRFHEQRLQRVVLDPGVLCGVHGFHCLGDATENRVYGTASPLDLPLAVNGFLLSVVRKRAFRDFKSWFPVTTLPGGDALFYPQYFTAINPQTVNTLKEERQMRRCSQSQN